MSGVLRRSGAIAAAVCAASCYGAAGDPLTSTLNVRIADAVLPFDSVARVDLFIHSVEGRMPAADSQQVADEPPAGDNIDPTSKFVTLGEVGSTINILALDRGASADLGQITLPIGTYLAFRLIIDTDRSSVTLRNGTVLTGTSTPPIQWSKAGTLPVQVVLDEPVELTDTVGVTLMLDLDLARSFVPQGTSIGASGLRFVASLRGCLPDHSGFVSGTVRQDSTNGALVPGATIEVLKAGTAVDDTTYASLVRSGKTDATGSFRLAFLPPGTYALRASPPRTLTSHLPVLSTLLTVSAGTDADGNLLVLPHN